MIYCGNKLLNINNGAFLLCCAIGVYINVNNINHGKPLNLWAMLFFVVAGFIITVLEAYYFELTDNELIVYNYMLPFINQHYALADITLVKIGDVNRRSVAKASVKITTDSKTSMAYRASSLTIIDWQKFIDALGSKQINVSVSASKLVDVINFK